MECWWSPGGGARKEFEHSRCEEEVGEDSDVIAMQKFNVRVWSDCYSFGEVLEEHYIDFNTQQWLVYEVQLFLAA